MKFKELLHQTGGKRIPNSEVHFTTLSGAVPSLTSFQNQQLSLLSAIVDGDDYGYLEDMQDRLNQTITTINGTYEHVETEFLKLYAQNPPMITGEQAPDNVIPFKN